MNNVDKFVEILKNKNLWFYHFTDTRNLPTIRQKGLLSTHTLKNSGIQMMPGGNDWSLTADGRSGMDKYVHICFFKEHPMEFIAKKEGRIESTRFLRIDPSVLQITGTMISDMVSNHANAKPKPPEEIVAKLDLEVIYKRTDWKDPKIQARIKRARLYEILVPNGVPIELIRGLE